MTGQDDPADATRFAAKTPPRSDAPSGDGGRGTIPPGSLLGHTYRIERRLARGGMGEIYRARHAELDTEHAIKIILPELADNPKVVDLFRREASVLRNVRDDAVVAYDGVFRDENGRLYLVMEFVEGPSLSDLVKDRPFRPDEVRRLRHRLARGLAAAHDKGVVHRDISPDNVILPDGRLENAKIIDFGIAKLADPGAGTIVGEDFAGKYSFVSPEQLGMFGGAIDSRSDIYSLGLVLAAAALGRPLEMGMSPISVVEARRSVPDLGQVPPELRGELSRMLQPDPADRPQSMRELVGREPDARHGAAGAGGAVAGFDDLRPAQVRPSAGSERSRRSGKGFAAGLAAIGALAAVAAGLYLVGPAAVLERVGLGGMEEPPLSGGATVDAAAPTQPVGLPAAPAEPSAATLSEPSPGPPSEPQPPAAPEPAPPSELALGTPPTPGPVPEPTPDPEIIRAAVLRALEPFDCAELAANPLPDGRVRVSGRLASEADRLRLDAALSGIAGGRQVVNAVAVRAWPACQEAVALLRTYAGPGLDPAAAPRVRPDQADRVYSEGERLIVEVTGTSLFNQYLYVDYIDSEGQVVHLLPSPRRADNRLPAGERVMLGTGDEVYRVGAPFGPSLILAIATPQPLFDAARDQVESADAYFPALRRSLERLQAQGTTPDPLSGHVFTAAVPR